MSEETTPATNVPIDKHVGDDLRKLARRSGMSLQTAATLVVAQNIKVMGDKNHPMIQVANELDAIRAKGRRRKRADSSCP